jgi:hypothetical protein
MEAHGRCECNLPYVGLFFVRPDYCEACRVLPKAFGPFASEETEKKYSTREFNHVRFLRL